MKEDLETEKANFENYKNTENKKISDRKTELLPLEELHKQILSDRESIINREAALEKEKLEYRERIRKELIEHLRNTSGK